MSQGIYGIIYKAENKVNGKIYIGKTIHTLHERRNGHYQKARLRRDKNQHTTHIENALLKYDENQINWTIIETIYDSGSEEENALFLDNTEIYHININKSSIREFGYNSTLGGDGGKLTDDIKEKISNSLKGEKNVRYGVKHTEETKRKISKAHSGKKLSEDHIEKLRVASTGRLHTDEAKEKISEGLQGHVVTEETRQRISAGNIGKEWSKEAREKFSEARTGEGNPRYGTKHSEETIAKMKASSKGRKPSQNTIDAHKKKVICVETGEIFNTVGEASKHIGVNITGVSLACNGKQKTSGGFHWKFLDTSL